MDTGALKKFAPAARTMLREQVSARLNQVLAEGSAARREAPQGVRELEGEIARTSRDQVVERVAYTWFNRLSALRFMDANGYTSIRAVSPADGQTRPEILAEAAAGVIGEDVPEAVAAQVRALLDNRTPSRDPQGEAYRLLLVATCNHWHGIMPFMFEKIADCTELLMPEDLLSTNSLLARLRAVMTDEACKDVEIIGWLYQFYISEKKDEVFARLKKNVKITAENIPAATQLFTPHWIVRYLVENSLGRLWLINRPKSKLADQMGYYIAPEQPETDLLRISRPEEIRICDPACGSGHMLTYAFDLLCAIYEEEGYNAAEIPGLVLGQNLCGVEIDDRAGALAAFALAMKAAAKLGRRRFLRLGVQPNICVMQNMRFTLAETQDVAAMVGRDLFTADLRITLGQFEQAKNLGSLIVPELRDPAEVARVVRLKDFGGDLLLRDVQERLLKVLEMAEALSPKYNVVVANPPYMGGKGMNEQLLDYTVASFPEGKNDLMTSFIIRATYLYLHPTVIAFVTLDSWMFTSSYEEFRSWLFRSGSIRDMLHVGWNCFPEGHVYNRGTAFIYQTKATNLSGRFIDLSDVPATVDKQSFFMGNWARVPHRFTALQSQFAEIPGQPLAYSLSKGVIDAYARKKFVSSFFFSDGLTKTGDNEQFLRFSWELSARKRDDLNCFRTCIKGGESRKYYGNTDVSVNWTPVARKHYRNDHVARISPEYLWNKGGITWTKVSSKGPTFRWFKAGMIAETGGPSVFLLDGNDTATTLGMLGFLNSKVSITILERLSPTINVQTNDVLGLPVIECALKDAHLATARNVSLAEIDWSANERAREFKRLPLLSPDHRADTLDATYARVRAQWQDMTCEMRRLEEENNHIFIDAYGLQGELTPEVPIKEVTLTCNPAYRYGGERTEAELEELLRADTMREFVSYAVGCMFGRYSPDAPGLILADPGEGLEYYHAKVPHPTFEPKANNVMPVLDGEWFADDITTQFRQYLRVTFGKEHFQENLAFVEDALGKDIRKYFTRDFFNDHVKRYKKRPIYWLFSSPKGTFNALIYMHRYRSDTVSVVLNDNLRELRSKLEAYRRGQEALSISADATQGQKTKALKQVETIGKQIAELASYERDVLFPLATRRIEIDLDDGVKANYLKFGDALKPITGLNDVED